MRFSSMPTEKGYTFACSRKNIEASIGRDKLRWLSYEKIRKSYEFDGRVAKRPILIGTVVISMSFSPGGESSASLYPIQSTLYGQREKIFFAEIVLPKLVLWLETKEQELGTADSTNKSIIVEWTGEGHRFHEIFCLYASN